MNQIDQNRVERGSGKSVWHTPQPSQSSSRHKLSTLTLWDRPYSLPSRPLESLTLPGGCRRIALEALSLSPAALSELQRVPASAALKECVVCVPGLTDEQAAALARAPFLQTITALDISRHQLTPRGFHALLSSRYLGSLTEVFLRDLRTTEDLYKIVHALPELAKVRLLGASVPIVPELDRVGEPWWVAISPDRGPGRFKCCEALFDTKRFPSLCTVSSAGFNWQLHRASRILERGPQRNEPGIDFL